MRSSVSELQVSGELLLERITRLSSIGADPEGGVTRLAYSPEDVRARELTADWMAAAGLEVWIDPATNLFGRLPGSDCHAPALVTGSHLDTVVRAGPLDGPAGVVSALAAAQALRNAGTQLRRDLIVVAFSNEEGAKGTPGMVGSKAVTGALTARDLDHVDTDGVTLSDRIRDAGGDPARIADAAWSPERLAAFFELHIEQGPVLHAADARIGVVTGITGQISLTATVTGAANHAGTTPMSSRQDAAVAAARLVLAVQDLAGDGHVRVATAGTLTVGPGVRNVVPGRATVGIDIRDDCVERIQAGVDALDRWAADIAASTDTTIELHRSTVQPAVMMDQTLTGHIADSADALGASRLTLSSGAGHDAQVMAAICPSAMIFVPSIHGISHAPTESTAPRDLVLGANVLLRALVAADSSTRTRNFRRGQAGSV
ncbi:Zn-dependent hydrolase [Mycolicibacterium mengxianglii]|uniref:Zn-dependent hydrolase n=1 Tax=Mycolicibacterium mengxianglii TaxID=2736649 RepID=UPI0018EF14EA|nr:Zn-dependent hydrolase [Mycolicibacterium mengxianglii]